MRRRYKISLFLLLVGTAGLKARVYPGLYEPDGTPHPIHQPNPVTGETINVLDFGADPADNENDDRPAIESALQSAESGDELYFPAGVYNINSTKPGDRSSHFRPKSGVNWRGESMSKTVLKSGFGDKTIDRFLKMRAVHDLVISRMTLTSDFRGRYPTDHTGNNPGAGGPKYVISIEDDSGSPSFNITVDSVLVENYRSHGVRLSKSHDVVVRNSTFQKATDVGGGGAGYGVSIQGNGQHGNDSRFNLVEYCRAVGPYIRHGFLLQYATHNNQVRYNYCEDNRLDAIDLHGEDEYLNEINGNEVRNVLTGAGVGVGNTGSTHDKSGPHNYIHDNTFINCREGVKVYLGSPDTRIENNTVTESMVNNGKGIYILNGPRSIVRGNKIFNNTGLGFSGILLRHDGGSNGQGNGPPVDVRILENDIYDNVYGVRLEAGERIVYEENNVRNNSASDYYVSSSVTFHKLLTASVIGAGWVQTEPPGDSFPEGRRIDVFAIPLANWQFDHWEGDVTGPENPVEIFMDQSKQITAVFSEKTGSDEVNLFTSTTGGGRIERNPPQYVFNRGAVVQLQAVADSAWKFVEWTGDISGTSPAVSVVMDADKNVTAVFEKARLYSIVPWIIGDGELVYNPPGGTYVEGTAVEVLAVPEAGWQFKTWGGALSGTQNPATLVMDSQKAVQVTFERISSVKNNGVYKFGLEQNFPNPFNLSTTLSYSLKKAGFVSLSIYNLYGEKVAVLVNNKAPAGFHTVRWNGATAGGTRTVSGVYYAVLETEEAARRIKILLVK